MTNEELKELLDSYNDHLVCGDDEKNSYYASYLPELIKIILNHRETLYHYGIKFDI